MAEGATVTAVRRRGKFLVLPLETVAAPERRSGGAPGESEEASAAATAPRELIIHLGMTGVVRPDPPPGHLRVRMELDPGPDPMLYFEDPRRFGRFLVAEGGAYDTLPTLARMGPEPLSDAFTAAGFTRALKRSRMAVKTHLLSQRPVAGVGNIYADEALWRAGVHPETPADRVPRAKASALHGAIRDVLASAVAGQGTTLRDYRTVNGNVGSYAEQLDVYGHEGEPCPRCGTPVSKIELGGRGTHFCSRCQRRRG